MFLEILYFCLLFFIIFVVLSIFNTKSPIYASLWLIVFFLAIALLLLAHNAEFLAFMYILVYVGAVMVLILWVVMTIPTKTNASYKVTFAQITLLCVTLLLLFVLNLYLSQASKPMRWVYDFHQARYVTDGWWHSIVEVTHRKFYSKVPKQSPDVPTYDYFYSLYLQGLSTVTIHSIRPPSFNNLLLLCDNPPEKGYELLPLFWPLQVYGAAMYSASAKYIYFGSDQLDGIMTRILYPRQVLPLLPIRAYTAFGGNFYEAACGRPIFKEFATHIRYKTVKPMLHNEIMSGLKGRQLKWFVDNASGRSGISLCAVQIPYLNVIWSKLNIVNLWTQLDAPAPSISTRIRLGSVFGTTKIKAGVYWSLPPSRISSNLGWLVNDTKHSYSDLVNLNYSGSLASRSFGTTMYSKYFFEIIFVGFIFLVALVAVVQIITLPSKVDTKKVDIKQWQQQIK